MNKKLLVIRYVFFDFVAAVIVWILFMVFRWVVNDGRLITNISIFIPNYNYISTLILFPIFCVFVYYLSGYYVNPIKDSKIVEILSTALTTILISVVVFFVLLLDDYVISYQNYYYSLVVLIGLLFTVTSLFRWIEGAIIRRNFKKNKWTFNTLIVGTGTNAQRISNEIKQNSRFNTVVGFIKVDGHEKKIGNDEILGNQFEIGKVIEHSKVNEVIVALDNANEKKIFDLINKLFQYDLEIQFTPFLFEILTGKVRIEKYGLNPLISVTQSSMSDWEICIKRTFDVFSSLFSLILLSPLILCLMVAIKVDSKGSVFFKQERIGLHGKPFFIYKFRTMKDHAENGTPLLSSPDDERITRIGRFLRKYRLDEIPQFWNVIKGDMSIVGPRPERKFYIEKIIEQAPYYCLLYKIRPGLTSWGPIKIGYSDSVDKMIERLNYDIMYIENMNLLTDLKIVLSTLEIIFKGKGM